MKPLSFAHLVVLSSAACEPAPHGSPPGTKSRVVIAEDPAPESWTPPKTKLPASVVEETSFLLAHGMADLEVVSQSSLSVFAMAWEDRETTFKSV